MKIQANLNSLSITGSTFSGFYSFLYLSNLAWKYFSTSIFLLLFYTCGTLG